MHLKLQFHIANTKKEETNGLCEVGLNFYCVCATH